jgi:CSLREA domain-containing protein
MVAVAIAVVLHAPSAFATPVTYTVNSNGDEPDQLNNGICDIGDGHCTLRAAIQEANANSPDADTINFAPSVTGQILLTSSLPDTADDVTINGPGADQLAIDGASTYRVLVVQSGTTSISGLTIRHGRAAGVGANIAGGGILSAGNLTLNHVVVTQNNANGSDTTYGGGIYAGAGTLLTLMHSTVSDNNSAVETATISPNAYGGGIYLASTATLMLDHSTVSGNHASATVSPAGSQSNAGAHGGGIYADGSVQVDQSTISGNAANATGASGSNIANAGGLAEGNNGTLAVTGSTFSDNALAASGTPSVFTDGANIAVGTNGGTFRSSIVANPVGASSHDCFGGSLGSNGYNLDEDSSCGFNQSTDIAGDPMLGSLTDNGGPTQTQALPPGSPAIDQGKSFGATTDQRGPGYPRVSDLPGTVNAASGDGADIGAFELDSVPPHKPAILASTPKSPANNNNPKLKGLAEAGSIVRIYKTADCTGPAVKMGSAATFFSPGLPVNVPNNSTTPFHATATDASNNKSACSSAFTYVEDSTPPNTTISSATITPSQHRATFSFSSTEAGSKFQCRLDGQSYAACSSPKSYSSLPKGSHTFRVRAVDKAGNMDPTPASRAFTI